MRRFLISGMLLAMGLSSTRIDAAAQSYNPCDSAPTLPQCDSALGPLSDVTAHWRNYQPALLQPVPISDYCADESACAGQDTEDAQPPQGAGWCGTENPASFTPASTEARSLPSGIPVPPGKHSPFSGSHYCLLRYVADDFTPICSGCHRLFIDYSKIPPGNATSPASDGHWATRITVPNFSAMGPFNGHSPNIKNICSDKFFNPSPGATCVPAEAGFDNHSLSVEGDSTVFHHFPFEGRYYNGPAYLVGDGVTVPYHWMQGAYVDVVTGSPDGSGEAWYGAGYRSVQSLVPDTDQSYGCLCEVPPFSSTTFSANVVLAATTAPAPTPAPSPTGSPAPSSPPPSTSTLPNTTGANPILLWLAALSVISTAAVLATAALRRRVPSRLWRRKDQTNR